MKTGTTFAVPVRLNVDVPRSYPDGLVVLVALSVGIFVVGALVTSTVVSGAIIDAEASCLPQASAAPDRAINPPITATVRMERIGGFASKNELNHHEPLGRFRQQIPHTRKG